MPTGRSEFRSPAATPVWDAGCLLQRLLLLLAPALPAAADSPAVAELPLEELMDLKVYSASRFTQKKIDAPAAVTIVPAQEIKDHGYRTLADILRTVPGLYTGYDRAYTRLGVRGFGPPGDYNPRVLLLIDGYRVNEVIYDQAFLGTDFYLDNELIDRVEFVPGPGSAVYGNNALLGVINIITKTGKGFGGMELAGEVWSYGTDKERLSYGRRFSNGVDLLLSGSHFASDGQNLYFQEFDKPETNHGVAVNLDHDESGRLFGKISWEGLTFETGWVNRTKWLPTADLGTVFNGRPFYYNDSQAFFDLRYEKHFDPNLNVAGHAFVGMYDFTGLLPYAGIGGGGDPSLIVKNKDQSSGRWGGAEFKLTSTHFEYHKLLAGTEYQNNWVQNATNYDVSPYSLNFDLQTQSYRVGVYAQDEFSYFDPLTFTLGVRYDHYSTFGNTVNPRAAAIYKFTPETALKLIYGQAFRGPNIYELHYVNEVVRANPNLKPEHVQTYEVIVEHQDSHNLRVVATGFYNHLEDVIRFVSEGADGTLGYRNLGSYDIPGAELAVEYFWDNGTRLRTSYTYSHARDAETGQRIVSSPANVAKLDLSVPIWQERFRGGFETLYTSEMKTLNGSNTKGYPLVNLTLRTDRLFAGYLKGFEISATVFNLLDVDYATVGSEEHTMNVIPQDGINYRLAFSYKR